MYSKNPGTHGVGVGVGVGVGGTTGGTGMIWLHVILYTIA